MIYEERKAAFDEIHVLSLKMTEPENGNRRQSRVSLFCVSTIVLYVIVAGLGHAPFYLAFAAAVLISAGLFKGASLYKPSSKTNAEMLDDALSRYEAVNRDAFRSLQQDTLESGRLRTAALRHWHEEESKALTKESGFTATNWNFASLR